MSHDQQPARIASVCPDVLMDPTERGCNVARQGSHVDSGQQAVVDGHEDEAGLHESRWLDADHALVARLPAAAVNPENHRQILRAVGRVHIQHLPFVRCRVGDITCHTLGVRGGRERNGDEEEARDMFHAVHPTAVDRCALDCLTNKTASCLSIRAVRTPATAALVHTLQGPELGPRSRR